jgi:hypothetical protein
MRLPDRSLRFDFPSFLPPQAPGQLGSGGRKARPQHSRRRTLSRDDGAESGILMLLD